MIYRIEILKDGETVINREHEADNPQQAVNWLISKVKIRPFYSIFTINAHGDFWGYQVLPTRNGIKVNKVSYEKNVLQGTELNSILAGNVSIKRLIMRG